jgi:hypothetical protein
MIEKWHQDQRCLFQRGKYRAKATILEKSALGLSRSKDSFAAQGQAQQMNITNTQVIYLNEKIHRNKSHKPKNLGLQSQCRQFLQLEN